MRVGVPGLPAVVEALAEGRTTWCTSARPGRRASRPRWSARARLPLAGSYHTELSAYAALRRGDAESGWRCEAGLGAFYGGCDVVLSPSRATDARLAAMGIGRAVGRWDRGVDVARFSPRAARPGADGRIASCTRGG